MRCWHHLRYWIELIRLDLKRFQQLIPAYMVKQAVAYGVYRHGPRNIGIYTAAFPRVPRANHQPWLLRRVHDARTTPPSTKPPSPYDHSGPLPGWDRRGGRVWKRDSTIKTYGEPSSRPAATPPGRGHHCPAPPRHGRGRRLPRHPSPPLPASLPPECRLAPAQRGPAPEAGW